MFRWTLSNRLGRRSIQVSGVLAALLLVCATAHAGSVAVASDDFKNAAPTAALFGSLNNTAKISKSSATNQSDWNFISLFAGAMESGRDRGPIINPFDAGPLLRDRMQSGRALSSETSISNFDVRVRAAGAVGAASAMGFFTNSPDKVNLFVGFKDFENGSPHSGVAMALAVPVPTSLAMGGLGLIAVAVCSWRMRQCLR